MNTNRENAAYAPPSEEVERTEAAPPNVLGQENYRSQRVLAGTLTGFLLVLAVAWSAHGSALLASELEQSKLQHSAVALLAVIERPTQVVYSVIQFLLAVYFFVANKNARALESAGDVAARSELGDEDPEASEDGDPVPMDAAPKRKRVMSIWYFTPASMLWWHLVPVFGFFRPYQAMRAVWAASDRSRSADHGDDLVWHWWVSWLAWFAGMILNNRIVSLASSPAMRMVFLVPKYLLGVTLCLLTLRLVRALDRRQRRRAADLWSSVAADPADSSEA